MSLFVGTLVLLLLDGVAARSASVSPALTPSHLTLHHLRLSLGVKMWQPLLANTHTHTHTYVLTHKE